MPLSGKTFIGRVGLAMVSLCKMQKMGWFGAVREQSRS